MSSTWNGSRALAPRIVIGICRMGALGRLTIRLADLRTRRQWAILCRALGQPFLNELSNEVISRSQKALACLDATPSSGTSRNGSAFLQRSDVDFLEVDMCGYGLAPADQSDGHHFYRHRTGLAFPRHAGFRAALFRLCPGLSPEHQHVPLKGARPGSDVTRCTEAGVYAPQFVQAVVQALGSLLSVGGVGRTSSPQSALPLKAGGQVNSRGEGEQHGSDTSSGSDSSNEVGGEEDEEEEDETVEDVGGSGDEGREGSRSRSPVPWSEPRSEGRWPYDRWWVADGMLWVEHQCPRRRTMVPGGSWGPYFPAEFCRERFTMFYRAEAPRDEDDAWQIMDDWQAQGECEGPFPLWVGVTVFLFRDTPLPQQFPVESWLRDRRQREEDPDTDDREPSGGEDDEQDGGGGDGHPTESEESPRGEDSASSPGVEAGPLEASLVVEQEVGEGNGPLGEKAGGSRWRDFAEEGLNDEVAEAAYAYVREIDAIEDAEAGTWRKVCAAGDRLLSAAGGVQEAATALWIAREKMGRNNLGGVDDEELDGLLHEDWLAYLREVRAEGMPARFLGERSRVKTKPHPRARANMSQVYQQLMKDVAKHRVLVVNHLHVGLKHTISSPFEAVPKMLPNRTLSHEVRLVHDQRLVNTGTDKELHPPAVQPFHQQVIRRILWLKARYPGVKVVMAKKDVAGAFRLLWVDPRDVELFGGDVPWQPEEMGSGTAAQRPGDPTGMTMLYLVSSFGFSGSPGEWTVWGRATEELHRVHKPEQTRRDGMVNFDGKILVDDMVLIEPCLGLRPWVSAETYQWGVMKLLGDKAVNALKDAEEGVYGPEQLVWGVAINADTERMSLPEARILKGAYLLQNAEFNYGEKTLTLKELQRFRGIANGWAAIITGLRNELKAADLFLSGVDGGATIRPKVSEDDDHREEQMWEDLWHLFEDCRWLCARSETWAEKFGGDIREVLQPMERLAMPGQLRQVVFVSSDATLDVLAAIDWTTGHVCREELKCLEPWIVQVVESEQMRTDQKLAIHLGEMLSFVAFACKMGNLWMGKIVVYGGDNKVVYHWVNGRKSNVRAGRLLVRVLNMVEMRDRCRILGGWWRT